MTLTNKAGMARPAAVENLMEDDVLLEVRPNQPTP
jgi:hypothetical protein